eukprot:g5453.t1
MIDIAFNLTDEAFHGRGKYEPDLDLVLERAVQSGVEAFVVCGGSVEDSARALELCKQIDPLPTREAEVVGGGVALTTAGDAEAGDHGGGCEDLANGIEALTVDGISPGEKAFRKMLFRVFQTVGVHPTRCADFDAEKDLEQLKALIVQNRDRVVGFGEFGLDYDRLHFCGKEKQQDAFRAQLRMVLRDDELRGGTGGSSSSSSRSTTRREPCLPLYLHSRGEGCWGDLIAIVNDEISKLAEKTPVRGVVHSFTGTREELQQVLDAGFDVGLNGCSLKTEENCEVAKGVPLDKLHLETDCPYCDIRPTHFSHKFLVKDNASHPDYDETLPNFPVSSKKLERGKMLKSRNEPCRIREVAEVIAGLKNVSVKEVIEVTKRNSRRLFRI